MRWMNIKISSIIFSNSIEKHIVTLNCFYLKYKFKIIYIVNIVKYGSLNF